MISYRLATTADTKTIASLHEQENSREANIDYITKCIENYPSVVATDDSEIIGFAYCTRFAPDILELANLLIRGEKRGQGIGTSMLQFLEDSVTAPWAAIILVNSILNNAAEGLRPTSFYEKHGYNLVFKTNDSNVFAKQL